MSQSEWDTTERVLYGVMVTAFVIGTVSMLIEALRTRPKVQMMVLSVKDVKDSKSGPDSSAAE